MNAGLRWYLTSTAFYLVPGGIQMVLFPWLVAVYLHESATWVGIAQMSGQLPMLFLILWGGLLGDRMDQRRLLIALHTVMIFPPLMMAMIIGLNLLVFEMLIAWAMIGGVLGAFVQPARDAMLNKVAGKNIQRVVTLSVGVQFGIQILGFGFGSFADSTGPVVLLLGQAAFMLIAVFTTMRLPKSPVQTSIKKNALKDIAEGLSMAWKSEIIRPAILLTFAIGLVHFQKGINAHMAKVCQLLVKYLPGLFVFLVQSHTTYRLGVKRTNSSYGSCQNHTASKCLDESKSFFSSVIDHNRLCLVHRDLSNHLPTL